MMNNGMERGSKVWDNPWTCWVIPLFFERNINGGGDSQPSKIRCQRVCNVIGSNDCNYWDRYEQNWTYQLKATKTEMWLKKSCVPAQLRFQELAPWGHRKDARHIPAYPCSSGSRWPVFPSAVGGNRISSVLSTVWPNPKSKRKMMINHQNEHSSFFNILKSGCIHTLATASAWYCIPYLPRSAEMEDWYPSDHTNIDDKWGIIPPKKKMV